MQKRLCEYQLKILRLTTSTELSHDPFGRIFLEAASSLLVLNSIPVFARVFWHLPEHMLENISPPVDRLGMTTRACMMLINLLTFLYVANHSSLIEFPQSVHAVLLDTWVLRNTHSVGGLSLGTWKSLAALVSFLLFALDFRCGPEQTDLSHPGTWVVRNLIGSFVWLAGPPWQDFVKLSWKRGKSRWVKLYLLGSVKRQQIGTPWPGFRLHLFRSCLYLLKRLYTWTSGVPLFCWGTWLYGPAPPPPPAFLSFFFLNLKIWSDVWVPLSF